MTDVIDGARVALVDELNILFAELERGWICDTHREAANGAGEFIAHAPAGITVLLAALDEALAYIGLVVEYMEKGVPYWYGEQGLKDRGRALLADLHEAERWNTTLQRRAELCEEHWRGALAAWDEEHAKLDEALAALKIADDCITQHHIPDSECESFEPIRRVLYPQPEAPIGRGEWCQT